MGSGLKSEQIRDGEVKRDDLNVNETGQAVVARVVAGDDIVVSQTGVDPGTGDATITVGPQIPRLDEPNVFTERQSIFDNTDPRLEFIDNNVRLSIGYDESVGFTPGDAGGAAAEIIADRNGDIHYSTRPISSSFGHIFYTSIAGAISECFRISSAGINGFMKRAINFLDPVNPQDLATKNYVDAPVLFSTVTNNTTNINNTAFANAPVFGVSAVLNNDNSFSETSFSEITLNFDGFIEVNINVAVTSTGQRNTIEGRLAINGTSVGPSANTGYIRAVTGHNESSLHLAGVFVQVSAGDILSFRTRRESTNGASTTFIAGEGQISIKRVRL